MNLYRQTHKEFFFATAFLRHKYGLSTLGLEKGWVRDFEPEWLTEGEIEDFTVAYMMGGEL